MEDYEREFQEMVCKLLIKLAQRANLSVYDIDVMNVEDRLKELEEDDE